MPRPQPLSRGSSFQPAGVLLGQPPLLQPAGATTPPTTTATTTTATTSVLGSLLLPRASSSFLDHNSSALHPADLPWRQPVGSNSSGFLPPFATPEGSFHNGAEEVSTYTHMWTCTLCLGR